MNGRTDGRMDGWVDGRTDRHEQRKVNTGEKTKMLNGVNK